MNLNEKYLTLRDELVQGIINLMVENNIDLNQGTSIDGNAHMDYLVQLYGGDDNFHDCRITKVEVSDNVVMIDAYECFCDDIEYYGECITNVDNLLVIYNCLKSYFEQK